jgi:hydrogenase-4 component E
MSEAFASDAIDYLSVGMLIAAIGIAGTRGLGQAFLLLAAQSSMLAGAGLSAGLVEGSDHILVGAALTLTVKGILVPLLLWVVLLRLRTSHDTQPSVSPRLNVLAGVALALVFARALGGEPFHTAIGAEWVLPMAVTIMLVGILIMVTHQQALSQVTGFLVIENGMALAALTATFGMPLVVEFGILLDLLLALFVAFAYVARMHVIFGSLHTKHLRSLRG